jgi:hypothetical protein
MARRPFRRVLIPVVAALGVVGMAAPAAFAGSLDNDPVNNSLHLRETVSCVRHAALYRWSADVPSNAVSVTFKWYDTTVDPGLTQPHAGTANRSGTRATGSFRVTGRAGHQIALFFDALNSSGGQIGGLGRNIETVPRC